MRDRHDRIFAASLAFYVTIVVLTNTVGVKLFTLAGLTLPVSIVFYPLTFLVTDVVSEVYGAARARFFVVMGFLMSVVLLVFSLVGIALPAADVYRLDRAYNEVFGPIWRLLFASMVAFLLAQLVDVQLFHALKRLTSGRHLWLRNNLSTMVSQLVDSVAVNVIFLYGNPAVFSGSLADLLGIVAGVYAVKVLIALADTPLCYLGVWSVKRIIPGLRREIA
ncbi:MAG TPA: queuosine precursor transporter [Candidatus Polarisedimenticolaceae bacterium]|nr:queuosine precursor transporter [Candidatus Polarisedimenticolaceae bacterium]